MSDESPEKRRGSLNDGLRDLARRARRESTPAERLLWAQVRDSNLAGYKFRQQYRVERYRADFYCAAGKLIVELDGAIHDHQTVEDAERQRFLEGFGYRFV